MQSLRSPQPLQGGVARERCWRFGLKYRLVHTPKERGNHAEYEALYSANRWRRAGGATMNMTETRLSSQRCFDGKIIRICLDQVRLPDGSQASRECVLHPGGAAVLAVTPQQQVVLVRQHRYVCGGDLLELPAGKLDGDEDPADCALRELAEETPYTAGSVQLLHAFFSSPGFCNERIHLFWAQDVQANSQASPDEGELLELVLLDRAQVREALARQQIEDGKTLVALYWWLAMASDDPSACSMVEG